MPAERDRRRAPPRAAEPRARWLRGDALAVLRTLPSASVHCAVTSPPYWGLRDYQLPPSVWGGAAGCKHSWTTRCVAVERGSGGNWTQAENGDGLRTGIPQTRFRGDLRAARAAASGIVTTASCRRCGAWRGCLGLEPTPELYLEHMVAVFRELHRVLRHDGTLWLNMGDSYAVRWGSRRDRGRRGLGDEARERSGALAASLKGKDLVGMPWRLALALRAEGWYLRRDIIWAKPSAMPESATDRPTTAHEYVFLLTKAARYFYDAEAVREPAAGADPGNSRRNPPVAGWRNGPGSHTALDHARADGAGRQPKGNARSFRGGGKYTGGRSFTPEPVARATHGNAPNPAGTRNLRSVWSITSTPFRGAHFATFPVALAAICIRAGTSERGCCAVCGAPWARRLETRGETTQERARRNGHAGHAAACGGGSKQSLDFKGAHWRLPPRQRVTTGWAPTCACGAGAAVEPCTVLDPFSGAGTTLLAAHRLGRNAIGIELSGAYIAMARRRLRQDAAVGTGSAGPAHAAVRRRQRPPEAPR